MSKIVQNYYEQNVEREWKRLQRPFHRLELMSTLYLIDKYFPLTGHIADIGSGPGRYAIELLKRGYQVTLFDLANSNLEFARQVIEGQKLSAAAFIHGDARDMQMLETSSFDGALLMGPMYHVISAEDRAHILSELHRILKPGGTALAAYLNTWGILTIGLRDFPQLFEEEDFLRRMLDEWEQSGPQPGNGFTEAYFSTPPAALEEVKSAGLEIVSYAGAESFAQGMIDEVERIAHKHPAAYQNILQVAQETCELPQYRDTTDHLHIVARKPE